MKITALEEQRRELIERLEKVNLEICRLRQTATRLQTELAELKNGKPNKPGSRPPSNDVKRASLTFDEAQARLEELRKRRAN